LPYYSPHKLWHDTTVFSLKNAKDISALKAISQNLMHANLSVTNGVYGVLSKMNVLEQIRRLGNKYSIDHEYDDKNLIQILKQAINQLEEKT